eukprot:gene2459-4778_t
MDDDELTDLSREDLILAVKYFQSEIVEQVYSSVVVETTSEQNSSINKSNLNSKFNNTFHEEEDPLLQENQSEIISNQVIDLSTAQAIILKLKTQLKVSETQKSKLANELRRSKIQINELKKHLEELKQFANKPSSTDIIENNHTQNTHSSNHQNGTNSNVELQRSFSEASTVDTIISNQSTIYKKTNNIPSEIQQNHHHQQQQQQQSFETALLCIRKISPKDLLEVTAGYSHPRILLNIGKRGVMDEEEDWNESNNNNKDDNNKDDSKGKSNYKDDGNCNGNGNGNKDNSALSWDDVMQSSGDGDGDGDMRENGNNGTRDRDRVIRDSDNDKGGDSTDYWKVEVTRDELMREKLRVSVIGEKRSDTWVLVADGEVSLMEVVQKGIDTGSGDISLLVPLHDGRRTYRGTVVIVMCLVERDTGNRLGNESEYYHDCGAGMGMGLRTAPTEAGTATVHNITDSDMDSERGGERESVRSHRFNANNNNNINNNNINIDIDTNTDTRYTLVESHPEHRVLLRSPETTDLLSPHSKATDLLIAQQHQQEYNHEQGPYEQQDEEEDNELCSEVISNGNDKDEDKDVNHRNSSIVNKNTTSSTSTSTSMNNMKLQLYDRVEGRYGVERNWHPGTIIQVIKPSVTRGQRETLYTIQYDDGDFEEKVRSLKIRVSNSHQRRYLCPGEAVDACCQLCEGIVIPGTVVMAIDNDDGRHRYGNRNSNSNRGNGDRNRNDNRNENSNSNGYSNGDRHNNSNGYNNREDNRNKDRDEGSSDDLYKVIFDLESLGYSVSVGGQSSVEEIIHRRDIFAMHYIENDKDKENGNKNKELYNHLNNNGNTTTTNSSSRNTGGHYNNANNVTRQLSIEIPSPSFLEQQQQEHYEYHHRSSTSSSHSHSHQPSFDTAMLCVKRLDATNLIDVDIDVHTASTTAATRATKKRSNAMRIVLSIGAKIIDTKYYGGTSPILTWDTDSRDRDHNKGDRNGDRDNDRGGDSDRDRGGDSTDYWKVEVTRDELMREKLRVSVIGDKSSDTGVLVADGEVSLMEVVQKGIGSGDISLLVPLHDGRRKRGTVLIILYLIARKNTRTAPTSVDNPYDNGYNQATTANHNKSNEQTLVDMDSGHISNNRISNKNHTNRINDNEVKEGNEKEQEDKPHVPLGYNGRSHSQNEIIVSTTPTASPQRSTPKQTPVRTPVRTPVQTVFDMATLCIKRIESKGLSDIIIKNENSYMVFSLGTKFMAEQSSVASLISYDRRQASSANLWKVEVTRDELMREKLRVSVIGEKSSDTGVLVADGEVSLMEVVQKGIDTGSGSGTGDISLLVPLHDGRRTYRGTVVIVMCLVESDTSDKYANEFKSNIEVEVEEDKSNNIDPLTNRPKYRKISSSPSNIQSKAYKSTSRIQTTFYKKGIATTTITASANNSLSNAIVTRRASEAILTKRDSLRRMSAFDPPLPMLNQESFTIVLHIRRIEANGLKNVQLIHGINNNPYAVLSLGSGRKGWNPKTNTKGKGGSSVIWDMDEGDDKWRVELTKEELSSETLLATIMDENRLFKDKLIGIGEVSLTEVLKAGLMDGDVSVKVYLKDSVKSKKQTGTLLIQIRLVQKRTESLSASLSAYSDDMQWVVRIIHPDGAVVRTGVLLTSIVVETLIPGSVVCVLERRTVEGGLRRLRTSRGWISETMHGTSTGTGTTQGRSHPHTVRITEMVPLRMALRFRVSSIGGAIVRVRPNHYSNEVSYLAPGQVVDVGEKLFGEDNDRWCRLRDGSGYVWYASQLFEETALDFVGEVTEIVKDDHNRPSDALNSSTHGQQHQQLQQQLQLQEEGVEVEADRATSIDVHHLWEMFKSNRSQLIKLIREGGNIVPDTIREQFISHTTNNEMITTTAAANNTSTATTSLKPELKSIDYKDISSDKTNTIKDTDISKTIDVKSIDTFLDMEVIEVADNMSYKKEDPVLLRNVVDNEEYLKVISEFNLKINSKDNEINNLKKELGSLKTAIFL